MNSMSIRYGGWFLVGITALAGYCASVGLAQRRDPSEDLISEILLNGATDHPVPIFAGCGEITSQRLVARSLADLGSDALVRVKEAVGSLQQQGERSPFARQAGWLLLAYAKIEGANASEVLLRMAADPRLQPLIVDIDNSIALAGSVTSHVSMGRDQPSIIDCMHAGEPRHTVDELVAAWRRGERRRLETVLGTRAKGSLAVGIKAGAWAKRQQLGERASRGGIGYLFSQAGKWGEPWETLAPDVTYSGLAFNINAPMIHTEFKTDLGMSCGSADLVLVRARTKHSAVPPFTYLIDNPDILSVLEILDRCATQK